MAAAAMQHRLWCSCWRATTDSSGGGDGGSSLAHYNVGDMGTVSSSTLLAMAVVVMVVVVDGVSFTGVVILFERVGGGSVVGSFATILPGGIILEE